jgi:hypothetical protein
MILVFPVAIAIGVIVAAPAALLYAVARTISDTR